MRSIVLAVLLGLMASGAVAQDWGKLVTVSSTMGVNGNRLCIGEASRGDLGCPTYAPSLTTAGDVSISGNVSAAKFIGDGSGLTNIAGASADRIVSGTTSMLAISNTGYVSLTQSGVNTGWFDPSRGLVTIGVSSTGGISGTTGYFTGSLTTANGLYLPANAEYGLGWGNSSAAIYGRNDQGYIRFITSSTEAMRIVSSGFVGIGVSSPSSTLHVNGNITASAYVMRRPSDGSLGLTLSTKGTSPTVYLSGMNSGVVPATPLLVIQNTAQAALMSIYSASSAGPGGAGGNLPFIGIGTTPTVALEVSGTVSATNFVGNGSGLTGIASTGDRIVSGSVNMVAEQTSGTVRVSGTLAMVNTGNEVCNAATWYSFRVNPSTGQMQMCRP